MFTYYLAEGIKEAALEILNPQSEQASKVQQLSKDQLLSFSLLHTYTYPLWVIEKPGYNQSTTLSYDKQRIKKSILDWLQTNAVSIQDMLTLFKKLASKKPKFSRYVNLAEQIIENKVIDAEFLDFLTQRGRMIRRESAASSINRFLAADSPLRRYGASALAFCIGAATVVAASHYLSSNSEGPKHS